MSQIRNVLVCKICKTEAGDRLLDCGHGVCLGCIENVTNVDCPVCSLKTVVSAKTKGKNYAIASLWDLFKELGVVEVYSRGGNNLRTRIFALPLENNEVETVENTKKCWICTKNDTEMYCNTCHSFICGECAKITHDPNLGHIVLPYSYEVHCSGCRGSRSHFQLFKSKENLCVNCVIARLKKPVVESSPTTPSSPQSPSGLVPCSIREGIYPIGSVRARTKEILKLIKNGGYLKRIKECREAIAKSRKNVSTRAESIVKEMRELRSYDEKLNEDLMDQNTRDIMETVEGDNLRLKMMANRFVSTLTRFDVVAHEEDQEQTPGDEGTFNIPASRIELAKKRLRDVKVILSLDKDELNDKLSKPNEIVSVFKTLVISRLLKPVLNDIDSTLSYFNLYSSVVGLGDATGDVSDIGVKILSLANPVGPKISKTMGIKCETVLTAQQSFAKDTTIPKIALNINPSFVDIKNLCKSTFEGSRARMGGKSSLKCLSSLCSAASSPLAGSPLASQPLSPSSPSSSYEGVYRPCFSNSTVVNRLTVCLCSAKYMDKVRGENRKLCGCEFIDVATKNEINDAANLLVANPVQNPITAYNLLGDRFYHTHTTALHSFVSQIQFQYNSPTFLGSVVQLENSVGYVVDVDDVFIPREIQRAKEELSTLKENMNVFQTKMATFLGIECLLKDNNNNNNVNRVGSSGDNQERKPTISVMSVRHGKTTKAEFDKLGYTPATDEPSLEITLLSNIVHNNRRTDEVISQSRVKVDNETGCLSCPLNEWYKSKSRCSLDVSRGKHLLYNQTKKNYSVVDEYNYMVKSGNEVIENKGDTNEEDVGFSTSIIHSYPGISLVRFPENKTVNYFRFGAEEDVYDLAIPEEEELTLTTEEVEAVVETKDVGTVGLPFTSAKGLLLSNSANQNNTEPKRLVSASIVFSDGRDLYVKVRIPFQVNPVRFSTDIIVKALNIRTKVKSAAANSPPESPASPKPGLESLATGSKITPEDTTKALDMLKRNSITVKSQLEQYKKDLRFWLVFISQFISVEGETSKGGRKVDESESKSSVGKKGKDDDEGKDEEGQKTKSFPIVKRYIEQLRSKAVAFNKIGDVEERAKYTRRCVADLFGVNKNDENILSSIIVFPDSSPCKDTTNPSTKKVNPGDSVSRLNAFVGAPVRTDAEFISLLSCVETAPDKELNDKSADGNEPLGIGHITEICGDWATVVWKKSGVSNKYNISGVEPDSLENKIVFVLDDDSKVGNNLDDSKKDEKPFGGYPMFVPYMVRMGRGGGGCVGIKVGDSIIGNKWRLETTPETIDELFVKLKPLSKKECKVGTTVTIGSHFVFSQNFDIKKMKKLKHPKESIGTIDSGIIIPYGIVIQMDIVTTGWIWVCWLNMSDIVPREMTGKIIDIMDEVESKNFVINCYPIEKISSLSLWPIQQVENADLGSFLDFCLRPVE